mgnify:FL=1
MIQEIIVFAIVAAALGFTGRSIYKKFRTKGHSGCGCTGCDQDCGCSGKC